MGQAEIAGHPHSTSERAEDILRIGDEYVRHIGCNQPARRADELGQLLANNDYIAPIECGLRVVERLEQAVLRRPKDLPDGWYALTAAFRL